MNKNVAVDFAREVVRYLNPENWDGYGEKPKRFYDSLSYKINFGNPKYDIYVTPIKDDTWCYRAALTDVVTGEIAQECSSYGIDSVLNLADIIEDLERECRRDLCSFHVIVELQGDGLYSVGIAAAEDNCRRVTENLTLEGVEDLIGYKIQCYAEAIE